MGSEAKTRSRLRQRHGDIVEASPPSGVQQAIAGMVELLEGKPNDLADIVLDLDGVPEFNRGVYDIARSIPPGKTMTYGDIAKRLGGVELSRDVGQALGRNPCPIVVPCHRVLAAGGKPRRIFRQRRRRHQAQDAGDRRRGGQSHPEPVRLTVAAMPARAAELRPPAAANP